MRETKTFTFDPQQGKIGQQNPNCTKRYSATLIFFFFHFFLVLFEIANPNKFQKVMYTTREKMSTNKEKFRKLRQKTF